MKTVSLVFAALLIVSTLSQSCDMGLDDRVDCGFMGIDQPKCEAKGCCWKPARLLTESQEQPNDTPWCFFPAG